MRPTFSRRFALIVATAGGAGHSPVAPGTAGSLAALALYVPLRWGGSAVAEIVAILTIVLVGVWAASQAERALGCTDPGPVVIDEVAGVLVTLAGLPLSLAGVVAGFVLFRILDVVKPFPAGRLERLHGGWGIMLDDVAAGLYAHLLLRALIEIRPEWIT